MVEYWLNSDSDLILPEGQSDVKRRWKASLLYCDSGGVVTEYELCPKRRVRLSEMLQLIMQELHNLVPDDTVDCGFRIW